MGKQSSQCRKEWGNWGPKGDRLPQAPERETGLLSTLHGVVRAPPVQTPRTNCCSQTISGSPSPSSQVHIPEDVHDLGPSTVATLKGIQLFRTVPGAPITTATTMCFGELPGYPVLSAVLPHCQSPCLRGSSSPWPPPQSFSIPSVVTNWLLWHLQGPWCSL